MHRDVAGHQSGCPSSRVRAYGRAGFHDTVCAGWSHVGARVLISDRFWKISLHATMAMGCGAEPGDCSCSLVGLQREIQNKRLALLDGHLFGYGEVPFGADRNSVVRWQK
jgi:hypothetical protein